jgi:hypothetical protein
VLLAPALTTRAAGATLITEPGTFEDDEVNGLKQTLEDTTGSNLNPDTYTIGPSDLLEVKAIESDKFTTTERVVWTGTSTSLPRQR